MQVRIGKRRLCGKYHSKKQLYRQTHNDPPARCFSFMPSQYSDTDFTLQCKIPKIFLRYNKDPIRIIHLH